MKPSSATKETVTIRVPPTFMKELMRVASEQRTTPGKLALKYVMEALGHQKMQQEIEDLHELSRGVQEQVSLLRSDLVTALAYCLALTQRMDPKFARKTAAEIFRTDGEGD